MDDLKPLELAAAIRRDGYHDAADCIERLYEVALEASIENMRLREQMGITPTDDSGSALYTETLQ
jgi:hypothetical protein